MGQKWHIINTQPSKCLFLLEPFHPQWMNLPRRHEAQVPPTEREGEPREEEGENTTLGVIFSVTYYLKLHNVVSFWLSM